MYYFLFVCFSDNSYYFIQSPAMRIRQELIVYRERCCVINTLPIASRKSTFVLVENWECCKMSVSNLKFCMMIYTTSSFSLVQ